MNFIKTKTERGFDIIRFEDRYRSMCSFQKSSISSEDCIWLGIDDPQPRILASKTAEGGTGWVPYSLSEDVLLTTRMHLTRYQAKELSQMLAFFAKTGEVRSAPPKHLWLYAIVGALFGPSSHSKIRYAEVNPHED